MVKKHLFNIFPITNQDEISFDIQFASIERLPTNEKRPEKLERLKKKAQFKYKKPVALVRRNGRDLLALPASLDLERTEFSLTPDVPIIDPLNETEKIELGSLDGTKLTVAEEFLRYHLQTPLMRSSILWNARRNYFYKDPKFEGLGSQNIDIYRGFRIRTVRLHDNELAVTVAIRHKYIDSKWLTDYSEEELPDLKGNAILYHFGNRWYLTRFAGLTGQSIIDQKFTVNGERKNVYDYTIEKCRGRHKPRFIKNLDADGPAIRYQDFGKEGGGYNYGAAALSKLGYGTDHSAIRNIHHKTVLNPYHRKKYEEKVIKDFLSGVALGGKPVKISADRLSQDERYFEPPDLEFGNNEILEISRRDKDSLEQLGRKKKGILFNAGSYEDRRLYNHYLLLPKSMDKSLLDKFSKKLVRKFNDIYRGKFAPQRVYYDDREESTTRGRFEAIKASLPDEEQRGHALLVLPKNSERGLHTLIKTELWDKIKIQCADGTKIENFFEKSGYKRGRKEWSVIKVKERRFSSYIFHLTLALLQLLRRWPWVFAKPLNYDTYLGLDVKNESVGLLRLYNGGRVTRFRSFSSIGEKEKLSEYEAEKVFYESLKQDSNKINSIKSLVLHRDGRSYKSEYSGLNKALKRLSKEGHFNPKKVAILEIHKQGMIGHRMYVDNDGYISNPMIGSYKVLNDREGIVCTTGFPMLEQGTANPLHIKKSFGHDIDIKSALEDIYRLSHLNWPAPKKCMRSPITIHLPDDYLGSLAGESDINILS